MIEVKPKHHLPIPINKLDARFFTLYYLRTRVTATFLGSNFAYPKISHIDVEKA
jgi:hypothetical protein